MGEFKGTKGKWEVVTNEVYNTTSIKHKTFTVCVVNNVFKEICQSNALLISKAPEMLSMLEKVNATILEDTGGSIELIKLRREIESLIKKATEV